jgi:filamentous hemagglutinin
VVPEALGRSDAARIATQESKLISAETAATRAKGISPSRASKNPNSSYGGKATSEPVAAAETKCCPESVKPSTSDFFVDTTYSDKVLSQMKEGDFHAFPESIKAFQEAGQVSKITGGDGIARDMLRIPGEYKCKQGFFEFIKEADGTINHRFFRPTPGE